MPSVNVKSDILGINLQLESDFELDERGVFDVLREHDPRMPARLLKKFNRYREDEKVQNLTLKALDNDFFEGDGTFMDALGETASLAGEGLVNITLSSRLERQFKTFALKYADVNSSKYDESRWNPSVTEAAKYLAGLSESKQSFASVMAPKLVGVVDQIDEDMGKALQYAGLPDDSQMRKKVTDRLLGLDKSRTKATRGQAAVETWAMSATIGRKGQQYAKEFKDLVTGNATERGDKLIYLDYLYEQNRINEVVEEGAEIAAQLGGAKGVGLAAFTVDPEKGSVFGQPPADEQTLKDLQSGAVEPDLAQSLIMSIPMSPDFTLTLGAAGATHAIRNSVNRGAIIGLSAKASEESAFAATVKQLSELPKRTATQNALLNQAKKRLADVAGSQEKLAKLVAKNRAVAEAVGISAVEKGKRFSPTSARLMEALDRAPGPKAPFLNRTVGQALKAAGVSTEYLGRTVEFLHRLPEEALTTIAMRAGMEEAAAQQLARGVARGTLAVGAAGAATGGFEFDPDLTQLAIALVLTPGGHQLLTRLGRDGAIYGKELTRAQASSPLFQRLAQMEPVDASFTNVLLDRTSALTLGETVSNLRGAVFSPTREFGISPALKVPSAVLTHTGLGNTLTGFANTARTAAYASTFPLALGYAIGGEEGAGSALGASIFPLVVGMGLGHMARVKGKAELQQKMLGDETIYKEDYLSSGERNTFEKFSRTARQALATSALQNPDVVYNFKKGRGSSSHEIVNGESVITIYEKATTAEILSAVLGHEIAHHIDSYGFHPQIIEELLGSVEKGIPGAFTEFKDGKPVTVTDKDGNQVYKTNKEFAKHRQQYLDRLEKAGYEKDSPEYQSYANDDYSIAREIFASHGAAWYFGAEFVKNNYQGAGAKLMGKILDPIFNSNGLRKFFHRIGLATEESSGVVADPTGLMPGLKEIPALTKMIKKYNDEVRGLDKAGRKSWAARRGSLVDSAFGDELATASFTAKDLENPAIAASLRAGGHVSIREDGSIEVDASGKPVFLPTREVNKRNKRLANDILEIIKKKEDAGESFGAGHVTLETTADGRLRAVGRFLDPSIINELVKLNRYNPHQLDALKAINKTLKEGEGKSWNLFYYSALKWNRAGRKVYGQIKGGDRISLPFGIELTKDGNVIIQTISLEAFKKNLNWFAKSKGWRQKMQEAFGSRDADGNLMQTSEYVLVKRAMDLLPKYLDNHMRGIENGTEGSGISVAQRDFINAAIGRVNAEQVAKNPILEGLGDRRSQRQQSIRSRRLDRIGNARMGDHVGAVNLTKVGQNLAALMPGGRPKKPGREKRVTARFSDDLAGRIKALAAEKGISQNDALVELIEQGLDVPEATPEPTRQIPPKETTPPIEPVDRLTPAEEEILRGSPRTPEESALYRAAHKKRTDIELRKIKDSHKYFMPSIEQRKASKYGEVFKQAGLDDIELAKAARTKWKDMGNSSPFVQRFLSGETDDAPAFAQMKNGEWKPIELYHVGPLGVASGKSRNPLEIFNDSPTVKNSESWAPESTTVLVLDRKKAYDLQRAGDPDQKPLQVITNAKYIFDVKNPEHVKTLDEQLAATARDEGVDPSLQEFSPTDPSSLFAYETELKKRGWHGYRFEEGGVEQIAIFDSKRIKLNQDQRGEGKFYSKDRDFGKVSGLFGHRLATDRFSANPQAAKDIRFMPQMEFDFTPPKSKKPKGETRPNWWQVYKINPKDPNVYDRVADEIIWRGSPEHDGSIAEQYSTFLNLDVRKLRPAMARAHRRWEGGDRRFMPAQDEQVQELKDQLEMLGPDPMYRDYPELARAMENVENFLTPDERIEYLGLKVADRRARQEFERTFGVDPVIKPASARILARQAGQYQVYDNWKRFIHDPMNKMEAASAARRRFRTGDVDKMFMPAIPNFKDSWVLPDGTVLPLKGRPYRINSKNKSEIVDENYVAGDEHHLAILEWIQANPKNPLSQKVMKRLKADSEFKYGEDEVVDAWNAMEHAIDLGAVRLKKSIPEWSRTVLEANPKAMTAEQRRALELTAIEHELHVLFDRRDRSGTKAGKTFFDGRAPDSKMFMPAAYHGGPHTFPGEAEVVRASGKREFYPLKTKLPEDVVKEIQDGTAQLTEHPLGRFRMDKIGTGEGAQAYGHGLYFASKKEVAEHYRSELVDKRNRLSPLKYDGQELDNKNPRHYAASNLVRAMPYGTKPSDVVAKDLEPFRKKEISRIEGEVAKLESGYQYGGLRPEMAHLNDLNFMKEVLSALKTKNEAKLSLEEGEGSLYKVELAPKENEYLYWDKPLSEQPKGVREKLAKARKIEKRVLGAGVNKKEAILNVDDKFTKAGDAYKELATALAREKGQQDIRKAGGSAMGEQDALASQFLKEAGIPGIKYLDGSSRSKGKGDYNYVIFDEDVITITEKMFMPASEAKNPKAGDILTLDERSLKLFLPSPGNPNASLKDFNGKFVQVLTSDLSVVGDKKSDGVMISFQGGPGYLSVNDAWGFTNQGGAKGFQTRWERAGRPLVGITSMKQENHRASTLTREYYVRKFMEAINDGKIAESTVNRHIRAALKRAIDGKNGLTNDQKAALKTVKTIEDFLRVFPDKELIPWKATPMIYEKLDLKGLPIKQDRLKKLGLDTGTILRETRQPEYNDIKKGSLLAIAEYDGSDAVYRPDLNSAYPWSIPLKEKAFLKDFADIQDLSSRKELRGPDGEANMAVAMGAGVMLDRLGRREVSFMPSDPKASKRQPVNRVQQQAPSMPGNRFMIPAVTTGGKLSERFR